MHRTWPPLRWTTLAAALTLPAVGLGAHSLRAVRAAGPIRPEAAMAEPDWERAPAAVGFQESWPEFGQASHLPTTVKVLYDDRYLYVGARLQSAPGTRPVCRLHRRDQDSVSDWFAVYLDSQRDRRTAFGFMVNAAGVQRDAIYTGDSSSADTSWDAVWESAVHVDAGGWTAVLKIPLAVLHLRQGEGPQVWGINFSRTAVGAVRETSYWDLPPRTANAFASQFPDLDGLEGLHPRQRREWTPYLSFQRKFHTSSDHDDRGNHWAAGLDAHLGLDAGAALDLTVRPDFAQVEVDQAVLNLSTVETMFPEKRPFFLEGMELFQVPGTRLFYSRRVGRSLGSPTLEDGQTLVEAPATAELAMASKYTLRKDTGFAFSALGAAVENARGTVQEAGGSLHAQEIAPYTSYGVVRALQTLDDRGSAVGGFGSWVREAGPTGRTAQVAEFDGVLKSQDRSEVFEWSGASSETGIRGQTRGGSRLYGRYNVRWPSGWHFEINGDHTDRCFDPNDAGYLSRSDQQRLYLATSRHWDRTFGPLRNWEWGADLSLARDLDGKVFQRALSAWGSTDLVSFWSVWANARVDLPVDDDRELRAYTDPVKKYLHRGSIPAVGIGFDTPGNRPWYVRITANRSWWPGGPSSDAGWYQSIKLGPALELQTDTSVSRSDGELRYLETQGTTPVVGLRRMTQFNETVRAAYALTPNLSVQFLSQWLLAAWDYRDLQSYVDDATLANGANPTTTAFSDRLWNENLILRWEFQPGSTAYVVYTHGVATDAVANDHGSISPRPDLAVLSRLPSDDALQVKLSWLFR